MSFLLLLYVFFVVVNPEDSSTSPVGWAQSCKSYTYLGPREIELMSTGCTEIHGHVWVLTNKTDWAQMYRVFSEVKTIYGCIQIRNSNFQNLSFFEKLETVECQKNEIQAIPVSDSFAVVGNSELLTLGLKSLKNVTGPSSNFTIMRNNPIFCMESSESAVLKPAPGHSRPCNEDLLCITPPESSELNDDFIPENCTTLKRDLFFVNTVDKKWLERLKIVTTLVGRITLQDTDLKNFRMPNLQWLVGTKDMFNDVLTITCNFDLEEVSFHPNFEMQAECLDGKIVNLANLAEPTMCIYIFSKCGEKNLTMTPSKPFTTVWDTCFSYYGDCGVGFSTPGFGNPIGPRRL